MEISNAVLRLVDLAAAAPVLDGLIATDVHFLGPAVLAILPGTSSFTNVTFDDPLDAVLWDVDDHRTSVVGAVGVQNFTLTRCRFSSIGVALQRSQMQSFIEMIQARPR